MRGWLAKAAMARVSIGAPPIGQYCLGPRVPPAAREPLPAATIRAATLTRQSS